MRWRQQGLLSRTAAAAVAVAPGLAILSVSAGDPLDASGRAVALPATVAERPELTPERQPEPTPEEPACAHGDVGRDGC
jgi:hypothetical protein